MLNLPGLTRHVGQSQRPLIFAENLRLTGSPYLTVSTRLCFSFDYVRLIGTTHYSSSVSTCLNTITHHFLVYKWSPDHHHYRQHYGLSPSPDSTLSTSHSWSLLPSHDSWLSSTILRTALLVSFPRCPHHSEHNYLYHRNFHLLPSHYQLSYFLLPPMSATHLFYHPTKYHDYMQNPFDISLNRCCFLVLLSWRRRPLSSGPFSSLISITACRRACVLSLL